MCHVYLLCVYLIYVFIEASCFVVSIVLFLLRWVELLLFPPQVY